MGEIRDRETEAIEWRRAKVLELSSKGHNQNEICKILQIPRSTISRDVIFLRGESKEAIREYITEKLPDEVRKTFTSLDLILKTAWNTVDTTEDEKTRLNALSLINTVMSSRIEILGNVGVVDKVINLVTDIKEKQLQSQLQKKEIAEEVGTEAEAEEQEQEQE